MKVFVGVILSVFKWSVACPGHDFLEHVYGVTITCSSLLLHQKDIAKSFFESRNVV